MRILAVGATIKNNDGEVVLIAEELPDDAIVLFVKKEDAEKVKKLCREAE